MRMNKGRGAHESNRRGLDGGTRLKSRLKEDLDLVGRGQECVWCTTRGSLFRIVVAELRSHKKQVTEE